MAVLRIFEKFLKILIQIIANWNFFENVFKFGYHKSFIKKKELNARCGLILALA